MAGFSRELASKIAAATLTGTTDITAYPARWLALHTAELGDNSAVASEASYTGYARVSVLSALALTTDETTAGEVTRVVHNTAAIEFGANQDVGSSVISHWAIWSVEPAATGTAAQLLYSGELLDANSVATTRTIQTGDIPTFQAGQFKIKLV